MDFHIQPNKQEVGQDIDALTIWGRVSLLSPIVDGVLLPSQVVWSGEIGFARCFGQTFVYRLDLCYTQETSRRGPYFDRLPQGQALDSWTLQGERNEIQNRQGFATKPANSRGGKPHEHSKSARIFGARPRDVHHNKTSSATATVV